MQSASVLRRPNVLLPNSGLAVDVALIVAFSVLTAICAQISIPLPGTPVPLTGQTFAVLLAGAALGSRRGALSQILYLVEGIGLPVFSGGGTWATSLARGTEGFLVSFVVAAFVVGLLAERGWARSVPRTIAAMTIGHLVIYAIGILPYATYRGMGIEQAIAIAFLPFIPSSIVKIVAAALALPAAWKITGR